MTVERATTAEKLLQAIGSGSAVVGVIGLGYVGLPLAVTAAGRGLNVVGFDIDAAKARMLDAGRSYIEAVPDEELARVIETGRFSWTTDFDRLAACDAIIICVPTPLTVNREPDLSYVESTAREIAKRLHNPTLVVLESTTFPGTTRDVLLPILMTSGLVPGDDLFVGFSPEREDPGNKAFTTAGIPKIVSGEGDLARQMVTGLYARIVDKVVSVSSTDVAEAVKITENIFRAVNIALVNELKIVFDAMGIDVWEVIDGAATKPFGYMPFYPGPGLGGHCIPIDPFYLTWKAREFGLTSRFVELAGEINVGMPAYTIARLRDVLDRKYGKGLTAANILLVGISYKKNVPDMRESPSAEILETLIEYGARVDYLDPLVPQIPRMRDYPRLEGLRSIEADNLGQRRHDVVFIATDHDVIDYGAIVDLGIPIVDTRNAIARRGLSTVNVFKA